VECVYSKLRLGHFHLRVRRVQVAMVEEGMDEQSTFRAYRGTLDGLPQQV
jgi:hypothetical protein